ncbi:hypothetical protein GE118_03590 [Mycoplasma sp. NEAQ87857]|uniref:Mbov_0396 family ICE element transmembrane protein n=1 Tax=Mycoplasma sp. NEAQ87857 TaxID=2683967 RepID=UPI0013172A11|nr:DNA-directed RNA polymerase subunit alpha C-terminal domain-containing protein [Mycoplasma sp. NEAQ87857]QGZ97865.1 hypothetical protein GE118_03590 [Mycoplasma sp. NEAQ87857]
MVQSLVNGLIYGVNSIGFFLFLKLPFLILSIVFAFFNFIVYNLFNFFFFGTINPSFSNFSVNPIFLALLIPSVFIIIFIGIQAYRKNLKDPTSKALKNFVNNLPKYILFTIIMPFLVYFSQLGLRILLLFIQNQFTTGSNGDLVIDSWNLLHTSGAWKPHEWEALARSGEFWPDYNHWWYTHNGWGIETMILSLLTTFPIVFLIISLTASVGKTILSLVYNIVLSPMLNTSMLLEFNENHKKWLNSIKNAVLSLLINTLALQLFIIMSYLSIHWLNIDELAKIIGLSKNLVSIVWRIITINLLVGLAYKLPGMIIMAFGGEIAHTPQNYGNKILAKTKAVGKFIAKPATGITSKVLGKAQNKIAESSTSAPRMQEKQSISNLENLNNNQTNEPPKLPKTKTFKGAKLSTATTNALKNAGFKNLNEVAKLDDKALGSINGIGQKRMTEIKDKIAKYGLTATEIPLKPEASSTKENKSNTKTNTTNEAALEFNNKFQKALYNSISFVDKKLQTKKNFNKSPLAKAQNKIAKQNDELINELKSIKSIISNDSKKSKDNATKSASIKLNETKLNQSNLEIKQTSKPYKKTNKNNLNKTTPKMENELNVKQPKEKNEQNN